MAKRANTMVQHNAIVVSGESDVDSDTDSPLSNVSWWREFQQEDESSANKAGCSG